MTTADAIFMFGLLFVAVSLMVIALAFKRQSFAFGAIGGWLLLGVYSYTLSAAVWDIYFTLFFFCMGLVIVSALEAMFLREKPEPPPDLDSMDEYNQGMEKHQEDMDKYRKLIRGSKGRRGGGGRGSDDTRLV